MAHLVTYKSDNHVDNLSTLKNDQLINLADESWEFSPFIVVNFIYSTPSSSSFTSSLWTIFVKVQQIIQIAKLV